MLAAVKANGYGHGAVPVARALAQSGVEWFGVATPDEALELRRAGIEQRILLLGPFLSDAARLVEAGIDLTVSDGASLERARSGSAAGRVRVHLKVDTGMGRIGLPPTGALELARQIEADERLEFESAWTHFAAADEPGDRLTVRQIELFEGFVSELERHSMRPPLIHACNSAGLLANPECHYDLVRPGISLYGYPPSRALAGYAPDLKPVMTLTAPVTFVKRVAKGTPISYGASWRASRNTNIATVRLGYADGYPRLLANRGWANFSGARVQVAGRVCMDQMMLDVGELEPMPGDEVTIFGPDGPRADELGELAETVSYEILTSVSPRVERSYSG